MACHFVTVKRKKCLDHCEQQNVVLTTKIWLIVLVTAVTMSQFEKPRPSSGPSLEQIRAQQLINEQLRNKRKSTLTSNNTVAKTDSPDSDDSEDQNSTEPNDSGTTNSEPAKSPKGVLKTTTHGIVKPPHRKQCYHSWHCKTSMLQAVLQVY